MNERGQERGLLYVHRTFKMCEVVSDLRESS